MRRGRPPYPGPLTPREQEVLELLQQGFSNEQIAERLNISLAGAKFHVSEIISRLGVESRYEAAAWQPSRSGAFGLAAFIGLFRKAAPERVFHMASKVVLAGVAVAIVLLLVGVLIMASRGDDDASLSQEGEANERTLGPENAAQRLPTALLSPASFPDEAWTVTMEGDLDNERVSPAPVCNPLRAMFARAETEAIAQATRAITSDAGVEVEVNLIAFPTTDGAAELLTRRRETTDEQFAACLTENIKRQNLDSTAVLIPTTAVAAAPHGGAAFGGDAEFNAPNGARVRVHAEIYVWTQGNVAAYIVFIAMPSADLAQTAPVVLAQISGAIDAILTE
jgi:DNA-binding CsgD family transcriptional regulator